MTYLAARNRGGCPLQYSHPFSLLIPGTGILQELAPKTTQDAYLNLPQQIRRPDVPRFSESGCPCAHLSLSKKDMATNDSKSSLRASFGRFEELILRHAVDRPPWTTGVLCPKDIGAITDYVSNRRARPPSPLSTDPNIFLTLLTAARGVVYGFD